jgi:phosphohistidine phosphatase
MLKIFSCVICYIIELKIPTLKFMKLIVMRHGEAEASNISDKARNLTAYGQRQTQTAGSWLASHVVDNNTINVALVSPFTRAQQTYAGVISHLSIERKVDVVELIPEAKPRQMHKVLDSFLSNNLEVQSIILISHMPLICYLLDEILLTHQGTLFDTSSMAIIEYDYKTGLGELKAFYHPSMCNSDSN